MFIGQIKHLTFENKQKQLKAVTLRDSKDKSVLVAITVLKKHPIYLKRYTHIKKFLVHTDSEIKKGVQVQIEETRPYSKNIAWKIAKILDDNRGQS